MHLLFSPRSLVQGNHISHTATGVVVINSEGVTVRRNSILYVQDGGGAGVVFKESSSGLVDGNDIVHCSIGVMADSPSHPINRLTLYGNRIAHNIVAINFYGEKGGHLIHCNRFENNLIHVMLTPGGNPLFNEWFGNYWDDYQGFDRDHDGVGDKPYELYRVRRPDVAGISHGALFPQFAGAGTARFSRTPGAFFAAGTGAARPGAAGAPEIGGFQKVRLGACAF